MFKIGFSPKSNLNLKFSEGSPSCDDLPEYPQDPTMMQDSGDSLRDLCKYSFDHRVRLGPQNPTIVDMARVECPAELVEMTQIRRKDDPNTFDIEEENRPGPYQNGNTVEPCHCSCGAQVKIQRSCYKIKIENSIDFLRIASFV